MKHTLAVLATFVFAMSTALAGQARNSASPRPELSATLADLEKAAQSTQLDLANLRTDKWGSGLKLGKNSHAKDAEKTALSLKRNLKNALPDLIAEVRAAHGSVVTSFKLYDDLSVVCETLDSLVTTTETYGKKEEYGPLAGDFSVLTRIRRNLSSYIEVKAAFLEGKSTGTLTSSATPRQTMNAPAQKAPPAQKKTRASDDGTVQASSSASVNTQAQANPQGPKKIVIDDNVAEKKPAQKKATLQYSN
ncbi:MAG TPA: hypothetical protein VFL42_14965 [Terriglobales bacterium]|jgi:hypothetical protein|nr:hypothetical protein [Terriglobales bacterium]